MLLSHIKQAYNIILLVDLRNEIFFKDQYTKS